MIARLLSPAFLRFFLGSAVGVLIDLLLAYGLHELAGLSLNLASALSLTVTAILTYFIHEFWTFKHRGVAAFSHRRLIGFCASSLLVLAVRQALLWLMHTPIGLGESWPLVQLLIATGISFLCNYGVSRYLVFRS